MTYNKIVEECFFHSHHVGIISTHLPKVVYFRSIQKSVIIDLYMHCADNKLITEMRFKTNGTPYHIAGLEWLCRQLEGESLDTELLETFNYRLLIKVLEIPLSQTPVALSIIDIYREILALMKKKFEE
jgi:nitrogen fixation NifU-like protein